MRLAYQTNTWGGVVGHPAGVTSINDLYYLAHGSTEDAVRDIAAAGYEGFELFDGNLMQYAGREDAFEALVTETGLALVAVYVGANFIYPEILPEELDRIVGVARLASRFAATHLVIGGGAVRSTGVEERDFTLLAAGLDRAAEVAVAHGLTPSFHPHLGTCAESPEQIAAVFERTTIGFCPDTAHLEAGGGDPVELVRTYADRIPYVHLKDYADGTFEPLGEGRQDLRAIVDVLRAAAYDGWLTVELDAYPGQPGEAAKVSREFLEALLGEG